MDIENQVVSLELAKRLKELGVRQGGYFLWQEGDGEMGAGFDRKLVRNDGLNHTWAGKCSAFTAEELAEMAKPNIIYRNPNAIGKWMASIPSVEGYSETIADALGNLLVKRIQDGLDPKTL